MRWLIMFVCFMVLAGCTVDQEGVSFKQQVIDLGCDVYEDAACGFEQVPRSECEIHLQEYFEESGLYENAPTDQEGCLECMENLGCDLWIDIQPCIKICEDLY